MVNAPSYQHPASEIIWTLKRLLLLLAAYTDVISKAGTRWEALAVLQLRGGVCVGSRLYVRWDPWMWVERVAW